MAKPVISIVIVNYNYGRYLESAIKSVVEQDGFDECELIVVDGGSNDDSVEIIKRYSNRISWWVSEKDNGQSDAFNKAFLHAKGRLGCWVNADDMMMPGTLRAVLNRCRAKLDVDWICGGTVYFDDKGRIVKLRIGSSVPGVLRRFVPPSCIGGPSSFFSVKRLLEVGGFDANLHYTMDTDLWYRLLVLGLKVRHVNKYFWGFRLHGESKTSSAVMRLGMSQAHLDEGALLRKRYGISNRRRMAQEKVWFFIKCISLSFLRSVIDTCRWRGVGIDMWK